MCNIITVCIFLKGALKCGGCLYTAEKMQFRQSVNLDIYYCEPYERKVHVKFPCSVYAMVQLFYPWLKFYFLLFLGMVMYDHEMITSLKRRKIKFKPRDKIELQHVHNMFKIVDVIKILLACYQHSQIHHTHY